MQKCGSSFYHAFFIGEFMKSLTLDERIILERLFKDDKSIATISRLTGLSRHLINMELQQAGLKTNERRQYNAHLVHEKIMNQ